VQHDAFSDVEALKAVIIIGVTSWKVVGILCIQHLQQVFIRHMDLSTNDPYTRETTQHVPR